MKTTLDIKNLTVKTAENESKCILQDVTLSLHSGEVLALVGESGCGKSMLCKSIMRLLPKSVSIVSGSIYADEKEITDCSEREMQTLRGSLFSMVFQDPMSALDPTYPIGEQIAEAVRAHDKSLDRNQVDEKVRSLMEMVGISRAEERMRQYPFEFSGGMRQRVILAIALANDPQILIADEPTTALDVTIQAQILKLLKQIQRERNLSVLFVSHDLRVVAGIADRVAVMQKGQVVEVAKTEELFSNPKAEETKKLLHALPSFAETEAEKSHRDYVTEESIYHTHEMQGDVLQDHSHHIHHHPDKKWSNASQEETKSDFVKISHLDKRFLIGNHGVYQALNDVTFSIKEGEIFGLVGESGSGKSTVAKCLMGIHEMSAGAITIGDVSWGDICSGEPGHVSKGNARISEKKDRKRLHKNRQIIFQDSASSLNPRMKVADLIAEPLRISHTVTKRGSVRAEAAFQLKYVGMKEGDLDKYPLQLSGGERQRVAIARALVTEPKLLVADEPLASLDVYTQMQIVKLFRHLREEHGFTILFIAHDLLLVKSLCDRIGVMHEGKLVEVAPPGELFTNPKHAYTKELIEAIPKIPF